MIILRRVMFHAHIHNMCVEFVSTANVHIIVQGYRRQEQLGMFFQPPLTVPMTMITAIISAVNKLIGNK